jgi:glutathionylspermidine synthase
VRAQGLVYPDAQPPGGRPVELWDENACYVLELAEVLRLEAVTEELHRMCVAAVRSVVSHERYADFGIPAWAAPSIRESLESAPPSVYGRLRLWYDGSSAPKLLAYNAETPTSLVEAAIVQWYWLEQTRPHQDQWNSLHERLVSAWHVAGSRLPDKIVHFGWSDLDTSGADLTNISYLAETAQQAGLVAQLLPMRMIGWDGRTFLDSDGLPIASCFKLYPWGWMLREPYGRLALAPTTPTVWIEPLWKLLLSNKALLAVLWELFPGHPNLLPAYLDGPRDLTEYVAKPLLGRAGAAIRVVTGSGHFTSPGGYGGEGYCYQQFSPLPSFSGSRVVLDSWVVTDADGQGRSAGAGFRESSGLITDRYARFLPHFVTR